MAEPAARTLAVDLGGTRMRAAVPPGLPVPIEVLVAELGNEAGLAGAAAWRRATRDGGRG